MKYQLSLAPHSHTLLLFFTGWGTTPEVVQHLKLPASWSFCAFWDFRDVAPSYLPELGTHYQHTYIVAWSMGVWAADHLAPHLPLADKVVAINGTPLPMHDLYGIPSPIFEGTLEGLSDDNRARFDRRMCGGKKLLAVYNSFSQRPTEDLREELIGVHSQVQNLPSNTPPRLTWSQAIVSEKDLIVPHDNQLRYWHMHQVPVRELRGVGHYPFLEFQTWNELLQL